jgi:uncharacterized membrane protein
VSYALFNLLHVLGVVLFLGNLVVTAWWKLRADRSGSPRLVAFALRQVQLTDRVFTLGGALLLLVGGIGMLAQSGGELLEHGWLMGGISLFVFSAALWAVVLLPLQAQMRRTLHGVAADAALPGDYLRLSRYWALAGGAATLLPLLALWLMVIKPGG